jgi:IS5 family transposase
VSDSCSARAHARALQGELGHGLVFGRRDLSRRCRATQQEAHEPGLTSPSSCHYWTSSRPSRGRPRKPRELYADCGYDFDKYRRLLRERGIRPQIARRGVAHGSSFGKIRWVVERGFAWLHATNDAPASTSAYSNSLAS